MEKKEEKVREEKLEKEVADREAKNRVQERLRKQRYRAKSFLAREQAALSESSGRAPLPVRETMSNNGVPTTPMNEREPLPVQTPLSYPRQNNDILAGPTPQQTPNLQPIPPGMATNCNFYVAKRGVESSPLGTCVVDS